MALLAGVSTRPRREVRKAIVEHSASESSEEEEEVEHVASEESDDAGDEEEEQQPLPQQEESKKGRKSHISISLKSAKVCKVCKAKDHQAGFAGSIYRDCPNKPCYLCKKPGHTTATCPHRIASEHGVSPAPRRSSLGVMDFIHERQLGGHIPRVRPKAPIPNRADAAIIRLHSRRVTCLEFHPTKDNLLISGDKRGQIAIWDYDKVYEHTVYETVHSCIVNSMKFSSKNDCALYSSSSDGTVCLTDVETGLPQRLIDANPDGWHGASSWRMIYGMDINSQRELALAGDNFGLLYSLDMRTKSAVGKASLIHKKGTKIVGLHTNPVDPDVFITSGNDHTARIWDLRRPGSCLAELGHPRVVNSAYFSPVSGNKILTTCQDNRIRVWDCIFTDLSTPSREIVHSHDFNRYLTCFRAEWDPKDHTECLVVIGRYISDDFNGVALHPIDFIDVSNGQLVAEAVDSGITTISPVNKLHPRLDLLATGSSRSLFVWRPKEDDEASKATSKLAANVYNLGIPWAPMGVANDDDKKKRKGKSKVEDDEDDECLESLKKSASKKRR